MANKLRPCPFCNKQVQAPQLLGTGIQEYPRRLEIRCEPCGLLMVFFGSKKKTMMEEIYKRWNRVIKEETIGYE